MIRAALPRSLATIAIMSALVAACGGSTSTQAGSGSGVTATQAAGETSAAPGQSVNAGTTAVCGLLGDDEIEAITGYAVVDVIDSPVDTVNRNTCRWILETGEFDVGVLAVNATSMFDRTVEFEGATAIAGLGDRAVRTEITGTVLVLTGDTMIEVFGIGMDDAVDEELAATVLSKLNP